MREPPGTRLTAEAAPPALAVTGLEVRYGTVPAVRGIDLSVGRGEVVGLIGANGAGKSSTLAALMGLVPAWRGDIRLEGAPVAGLPPEQLARRGVALVPEGRHVYANFTVEENMRLGLVARDRSTAADDLERVYDIFPVVREFAGRQAGLLSGGQQQQLAIARALAARPQVLLLDEPSLGLAPKVVETVFAALERVRDTGVAILLVEQRAEVTIGFAQRTHVMRDGRLVMTIGPYDPVDVATLTDAYFGT